MLWNVGVCFGCSEHQVGDTRKAVGFLTRSGLEAAQDTVSMVLSIRQLGNKQKPMVRVDKGKKQTKTKRWKTQGIKHVVGGGVLKGLGEGVVLFCSSEELSPTPGRGGPRSHHGNREDKFGRFHANTNLLGLAVDGRRWDAGMS